jgi:hypothetical protein
MVDQRSRLAQAIAWNEYVAQKTGDKAAADLAAEQRVQLQELESWWASGPISA